MKNSLSMEFWIGNSSSIFFLNIIILLIANSFHQCPFFNKIKQDIRAIPKWGVDRSKCELITYLTSPVCGMTCQRSMKRLYKNKNVIKLNSSRNSSITELKIQLLYFPLCWKFVGIADGPRGGGGVLLLLVLYMYIIGEVSEHIRGITLKTMINSIHINHGIDKPHQCSSIRWYKKSNLPTYL